MKMRHYIANKNTIAATVLVALMLCTEGRRSLAGENLQDLQSAVQGIGTVDVSPKGAIAFDIVLVPEYHSIALVQLEEALLLERLSSKPGVSAVVLEGLLPEVRDKLWRPESPNVEEGLTLLSEGTISAAEFAYLYRGLELAAGETHESYGPVGSPTDLCGIIGDYAAFRAKSMTTQDARDALAIYKGQASEIKQIIVKINSLAPSVNKGENGAICSLKEQFGKLNTAISQATRHVADVIPELTRYGRTFCVQEGDYDSLQIDEELVLLRNLRKEIEPVVPTKVLSVIDKYKLYLDARNKASEIMVRALIANLGPNSSKIPVAIVGAAHEGRMKELLAAAGIRVAVVRLDSINGQRPFNLRRIPQSRMLLLPSGDPVLGGAVLDGDQQNLETWTNVQAAAACETQQRRKEGVVIPTLWFKRKSDFHFVVDGIAKVLLPGAGGGIPPRKPPGTYSLAGTLDPNDGRWSRRFAKADVGAAVLVVGATPSRDRVLVPLVFPNEDGKVTSAPVWVVIASVGDTPGKLSSNGSEIEAALKDAVEGEKRSEEAKSKENKNQDKAEESEFFQVSLNAEAKIFQSKEAALESASRAQ